VKSNGHERSEVLVTLRQAAEARPPFSRDALYELVKVGLLPYERPSGYIYMVRMSDVDYALDALAGKSA